MYKIEVYKPWLDMTKPSQCLSRPDLHDAHWDPAHNPALILAEIVSLRLTQEIFAYRLCQNCTRHGLTHL
jgi:hypothetical protein